MCITVYESNVNFSWFKKPRLDIFEKNYLPDVRDQMVNKLNTLTNGFFALKKHLVKKESKLSSIKIWFSSFIFNQSSSLKSSKQFRNCQYHQALQRTKFYLIQNFYKKVSTNVIYGVIDVENAARILLLCIIVKLVLF